MQIECEQDTNKIQMFCFCRLNTGQRPAISQRMVLTIREM